MYCLDTLDLEVTFQVFPQFFIDAQPCDTTADVG